MATNITIKCSTFKYANTRRVQYSWIHLKALLERLGWSTHINRYHDERGIEREGMIAHFEQTFSSTEEALKHRKILDAELRLLHRNCWYRLDEVIKHNAP
jgi:transcriptional regulatory protein LevR